ncbi:hypothetical protein, partial [Fibrobacter sp.]|uniref:hypothetical protein n=1 Tax=Fibrobacter sp. TaxID=35828 RepID=UPI00262A8EFB
MSKAVAASNFENDLNKRKPRALRGASSYIRSIGDGYFFWSGVSFRISSTRFFMFSSQSPLPMA